MRISTVDLFQRAISNFNEQQVNLFNIQDKIATGKKITKPSDDPIGASKALNNRSQKNVLTQFIDNMQTVSSQLEYEDTNLETSSNIIQRIRELTVYAGNGVLNSSDKKAIIVEMQERLAELISVANSTDASGEYMFSGFKSNNPPVWLDRNGQYQYQGDEGHREIMVSQMSSIFAVDNAKDIFFKIPSNTVDGLSTIVNTNTGTGVISTPIIYAPIPDVNKSYSIIFNPGATTFNIYDNADLAQPLPGFQNLPYTSGEEIDFMGVRVAISGIPNASDTFGISFKQPSTQDIFTTVTNIIQSIQKIGDDPVRLSYEIGVGLSNLDAAQDAILQTRSSVGARLNALDSNKNYQENLKILAEKNLSLEEDLDYDSAITQLSQYSLALQAAQQSFVKIQTLSIFNFIR